MAILDILTYPDPRLKMLAEPITEFNTALANLVANLEETMRAAPGGVGIAASQVGILQRVVIVDVSSKPHLKNHGRLVLINPEINHWEGFAVGREGCMSVPDYTGNVVRAEQIELSNITKWSVMKPGQFNMNLIISMGYCLLTGSSAVGMICFVVRVTEIKLNLKS